MLRDSYSYKKKMYQTLKFSKRTLYFDITFDRFSVNLILEYQKREVIR